MQSHRPAENHRNFCMNHWHHHASTAPPVLNEADRYSIHLPFFSSSDPLVKNCSFPCPRQVCWSVRLATWKCHWSFETFDCVCVCVRAHVCVSRWSVKERWAAVGLALPARRMNLCLMSTLVEPAFLARGPQMTSQVSALSALELQDLPSWNLGHTLMVHSKSPYILRTIANTTHTHAQDSTQILMCCTYNQGILGTCQTT